MEPRALQKLKKCTDNPLTDYQYTFFNAFHNYVQDEEIYAYIRGLNSRGLRNLWNHIVTKWLNNILGTYVNNAAEQLHARWENVRNVVHGIA